MALVSTKNRQNVKDLAAVIELLNKILKLEYSLIVFYPRIASRIKIEQARHKAMQLGTASVKHADTVAQAIFKFGGSPQWTFEPFPDDADIVTIFRQQLEKEKLAYQLHLQSAAIAPDADFRDDFTKLAREEQDHIATVQNILAILEKDS